MSQQNLTPSYPKVSQEQVLSVALIISSALQDPNYLTGSSYSGLMQQTITYEVERIKKIFEKGKTTVSNPNLVVPSNPLSTISKDYHTADRPPLVVPASNPAHHKELESYLKKSEIEKIKRETEAEVRKELAQEWEKLEKAKEVKMSVEEDESIKEAFSSLSENLDSRSTEYRDRFGILIRLEKMIRSIERIAEKGGTDNSRLSATAKLMEYQGQQMDMLERLLNMDKVNQIEKITRKFFLELRKHPDLAVVSDRYLTLLNDIE